MLALIGLFTLPTCFGLDSFVCNPNCVVAMANGTDHCNSTTGECLYGCQPGQAGPNCSFLCPSNCELHAGNETETCNTSTGQCLYGCQSGYAGPNCSVECPKTCASSNIRGTENCNATSEECLYGCQDGYYGARCQNKCNDAINTCQRCSLQSDNSVICDKCILGFYRKSGKCTACNYWCFKNTSTPVPFCRENDGYCIYGCKAGLYGFVCDIRCRSTCKDICSRDLGYCLTGCRYPSYCGSTCDLTCNDGCASQDCEQSCSCRLGCTRKQWGDKCDKLCSVNCNEPPDLNSNICERSNGSCSYRCKNDTFWGSQCNKACSSKCNGRICEQATGNCTHGCNSKEVYGIGCDNICNKNCVNGTCERVDGYCDSGCVKGSYGERCNLKCNEHCVDKRCNRTNGYCYLGCTHGWYDSRCNSECNGNCLHGKCDKKTGHCTSGCFTGWFGNNCSFQCSKRCLNLYCNRENGSCSYGFIDTILDTDLNMKGPGAGSNVLIGSLISGWSFFVIASVVLIVIVLRKRQVFKFCKNGQNKKGEEERENRVTQQETTFQHEVSLDNPVAEYENLKLGEGNTHAFYRTTESEVESL